MTLPLHLVVDTHRKRQREIAVTTTFHYQANGIEKTPQRAIKKTYAWSGEFQKHCEITVM